jgi:AraC-like DNA-binding protein
MFLVFEDRPSDSPFIERVWRCRSERAGTFLSVASSHCEMVVTRHRGRTFLTLRGPETKATSIDCPADGEWLGIRFRLGAFMTRQPAAALIDRQDMNLPAATQRKFWLNGDAWEYPDFENAETFIARLVRAEALARDAAVTAALEGRSRGLSRRSEQRHFLNATGMTYSFVRRINRARRAALLLKEGIPILDAVYEAGYFDQAHLTRSLTSFIGQTPGKILRNDRQLSYLYKTNPGR